jgi:hypothetical protein
MSQFWCPVCGSPVLITADDGPFACTHQNGAHHSVFNVYGALSRTEPPVTAPAVVEVLALAFEDAPQKANDDQTKKR